MNEQLLFVEQALQERYGHPSVSTLRKNLQRGFAISTEDGDVAEYAALVLKDVCHKHVSRVLMGPNFSREKTEKALVQEWGGLPTDDLSKAFCRKKGQAALLIRVNEGTNPDATKTFDGMVMSLQESMHRLCFVLFVAKGIDLDELIRSMPQMAVKSDPLGRSFQGNFRLPVPDASHQSHTRVTDGQSGDAS